MTRGEPPAGRFMQRSIRGFHELSGLEVLGEQVGRSAFLAILGYVASCAALYFSGTKRFEVPDWVHDELGAFIDFLL